MIAETLHTAQGIISRESRKNDSNIQDQLGAADDTESQLYKALLEAQAASRLEKETQLSYNQWICFIKLIESQCKLIILSDYIPIFNK
jgi:hypothetical protein